MQKIAKLILTTLILAATFAVPSYSEWPNCSYCENYCRTIGPPPLAACLCDNCPECAISSCPPVYCNTGSVIGCEP